MMNPQALRIFETQRERRHQQYPARGLGTPTTSQGGRILASEDRATSPAAESSRSTVVAQVLKRARLAAERNYLVLGPPRDEQPASGITREVTIVRSYKSAALACISSSRRGRPSMPQSNLVGK